MSSQSKPPVEPAPGLNGQGFHICVHAQRTPTKPAIIMGESGQVIAYAELDALSNRVAQLLRARGLQVGDAVAICLDNHPWYHALAWGAE